MRDSTDVNKTSNNLAIHLTKGLCQICPKDLMWDLNNNEGQQSEGIQSPDAVNT